MLFGVWVARLDPFDDNKERLLKHNVYAVSCFESIDELVLRATRLIMGKVREALH